MLLLIDPKHVLAFNELDGLGDGQVLEAAWEGRRQSVAGSFAGAHQRAHDLMRARTDLLVPEVYATMIEPCDRCRVRDTSEERM
jgi:hypothetical protein